MALIDFDILKAFGTTNERLREIFTAAPDPDGDKRKPGESKEGKKARLERARRIARDTGIKNRWMKRIQARTDEGITLSLRNWQVYSAVDLAWDSNVLTKTTLPLQLYAQGKISVQQAVSSLSGIKGGEQFIKKSVGPNGAEEATVDVPRFFETNVNLIRSVISRRHAAQKNKYSQLWPYYKYEPRGTGLVSKCRADVLSQRVDMMVDQFDHRHHDSQVMRDAFLYAFVLDFVRSSWEVEKQYRRKDITLPASKENIDEVVVREGIAFVSPHPSRVFWDNNYPLATINTDTGCEWMGFWDVVRYSDVEDNPAYFNKESVGWSYGTVDRFNLYRDYFSVHDYAILPPVTGTPDIARENDRTSLKGFYSSSQRDSSVFKTEYFERITPKTEGVGDYPHPVWVRMIVASDNTVVFAEILPSTPACYLGINSSDARQVSVSMAMDLMSYQDQMTNLFRHLLMVCQLENTKFICVNTDVVPKVNVDKFRERMQGGNWSNDPYVLEFSFAKFEQLGVKFDKVVDISEMNQSQTINTIFQAMVGLVEMTEKLMAMSPAEQGQPAPREISATEVNEIAATTSSVYSSISEDIDEWRAAKKRILYESLVACGKAEIHCPVKDRYTPKTIEAAGFKVGEQEESRDSLKNSAQRVTVIGSRQALVHDYIFTTRDGAERPVNTQAANTLVQLMGQILAVPMVANGLGKEKLYDLFNEIFRLSGAGLDLNLTLKEGEDDSLGQDDMAAMKQALDQIGQYLTQLAKQVEVNSTSLAEQEQVNSDQQEMLKGVTQLAQQVGDLAQDVQELRSKAAQKPEIKYGEAPDSIKRQMEYDAGYKPALGDESKPTKKAV